MAIPQVSRKLALFMYALGYLGISILTQTTVKWYQYFYTPPEANAHGLGILVPLSLIGVAMIIARIFDGVADPIVAYYSDKSRHRLGRRIPFILYGNVPLAATFILLWFPPVQGESVLNMIYLTVMLSLFFIFFTVVVAPYLALIGELTKTPKERISVTTMQGVAQVIGVMIAEGGSGALITSFGFRTMGVTLGLFSLASLFLTPLFIKEEKVEAGATPSAGLVSSVTKTLKNRNFALYLASYLGVWFGINTLTVAMPYLTEILLKKTPEVSGYMISAAFVLALLFSPALPGILGRYSKKQVTVTSYTLFGLVLVATGLFGTLIPFWAAAVLVVLAGLPLSVIFVVPNAMVADLAEADARQTGVRREGMFFGAQGLVMKIVIGLSSFIVPFFFRTLGYSAAHPLGIQVVGPVAGIAVLLGTWAMAGYDLDEKRLGTEPAKKAVNG